MFCIYSSIIFSQHLDNLLQQLPTPYIFLADFNGYNILWGGQKNDSTGELIENLHSGEKSESNPHILKDDFRKLQSRYKSYQQIYTDGSKEDSKGWLCCFIRQP